MQNEFVVSTDKKEKIKLESGIIQASWIAPIAYGGFEAAFEVTTVFVAEGSTIEVKGKSSKGKAPDVVKGKVFNNAFKGSLLIPEKVSPDADIWFEAKLPKHGLKMESNIIPARPSIGVKKLCWDRAVVTRSEIVKLTCQFDSGIRDGEEVQFIIYEHNPDSCDFKVISIPAVVKGDTAEIQWEFQYTGNTLDIPTEEEKKAVGKSYVNPQYYFVVAANGIRAGENRESGLLKFKENLEIVMKDSEGILADIELKVVFADGSEQTKKTDADGVLKIEKVPPGRVAISLTDNFKPAERLPAEDNSGSALNSADEVYPEDEGSAFGSDGLGDTGSTGSSLYTLDEVYPEDGNMPDTGSNYDNGSLLAVNSENDSNDSLFDFDWNPGQKPDSTLPGTDSNPLGSEKKDSAETGFNFDFSTDDLFK